MRNWKGILAMGLSSALVIGTIQLVPEQTAKNANAETVNTSDNMTPPSGSRRALLLQSLMETQTEVPVVLPRVAQESVFLSQKALSHCMAERFMLKAMMEKKYRLLFLCSTI